MIRDGSSATASNVFLYAQGGSNAYLTYRSGAGNNTTVAQSINMTAPEWMKLVRQGNSFTAYTSPDGVLWSQLGSTFSITMSSTVNVSLAVSSNNGQLIQAAFDKVAISSANEFSLTPSTSFLMANAGGTGSMTIAQLASSFSDTVNYSVSGLPSGASAAFTPASFAGSGTTSLTLALPYGTAPGSYPLTLTGTGATTAIPQSVPVTLIVQNLGGSLPGDWADTDIGGVSPKGTAQFGGGLFTIQGGSSQIAGTNDQFNFVSTALTGDGTIIARLLIQSGGANAQAGLMIRNGLDGNDSHAFIGALGTGSVQFEYRSGTNTGVICCTSVSGVLPEWFKLVRQANTFSAYTSVDGVDWIQVGSSVSIPMSGPVYAGLIEDSASSGQLATAVFDSVSFATAQNSFSIASSSPILATTSGNVVGTTIQQSASSNFTHTVNYAITGLPAGVTAAFSPVSLTGPGTSALTVAVSSAVPAGSYVLTVTGSDPIAATSQSINIPLIVQGLSGLPPTDWRNVDVGAPTPAGNTTYGGGVYTLQGGSNGVSGGSSDQFQFSYSALQGDGTIVARVLSEGSSGQAGIMMRDGLDTNASTVFLYAQGASSVNLADRSGAGNSISVVNTQNALLPSWFKIGRQGSTFTAYTSPDGNTWTQFGSPLTISMSSTISVGLVSGSTSYGQSSIAVFDRVAVTNVQSSFWLSSPTNSLSTVGGSVVSLNILQNASSAFADTVTYTISGVPAGANATFTPNWEVENYNPVTGQAVYWIQVPLLSHTADTTIYLFYGNSQITTDQSNPSGTWDSNFKGIWHLPNGSALSLKDSTANAGVGINNNSVTATAGRIGGAALFNAANSQYIDLGNSSALNITGAITYECWLNFTGTLGNFYIPLSAGAYAPEIILHNNDGGVYSNTYYFQMNGGASTNSSSSSPQVVPNTWYHVVGVYDGNTISIYENGSLFQSHVVGGGANTGNASNPNIGRRSTAASYWPGIIDEVRISNSVRSADWIATEFNNQSNPSTFVTVGSEGAGNSH